MFFLLFQSEFQKLKNRVRRLQKRGCTDPNQIFDEKIVKESFRDIRNLIRKLGFLVRAKLISGTEQQDIVIYLNEASRGFMWSFVNDFMTECLPRKINKEDSDYLNRYTDSNLEEMNNPLICPTIL